MTDKERKQMELELQRYAKRRLQGYMDRGSPRQTADYITDVQTEMGITRIARALNSLGWFVVLVFAVLTVLTIVFGNGPTLTLALMTAVGVGLMVTWGAVIGYRD